MELTTFERRALGRKCGRVEKRSADLTLLAMEVDFRFNGFCIIRNRDARSAVVSDANRFIATVMQREGTWERKVPRFVQRLDLTSWESVFGGMKAEVVILENERRGWFHIGPIVRHGATSVTVHHFDATGRWKDEKVFRYRELTCCTFLDGYSTTYAKHLEWAD